MSTRQTGRVTVKVDGDQLRSKPGATAQMGGPRRPVEMSDQGETVYKENLIPGMIKCTMIHCADTDLVALRNMINGTVQYETDTSVMYTMAGAVTSEIGDLSNGEVEVTFMGDPLK
jgi:hypothetical protein